MSDCHPCQSWAEPLSLAAAGCLSPDEEREVRRHLETCRECHERYRQLTELCGLLAESRLPAESEEAAIVERVMSEVAPTPSQRSINRRENPRVFDSAVTETSLSVPQTRSPVNWRWIMRHPVSRVSAAAVLVFAVGAILLWFHGVGATPAVADFLKPIVEAKTLMFKSTSSGEGQPSITAKMMIMAPNRMRMEQKGPHGHEMVQIIDGDTGKTMMLLPAQKIAILTTYVNVPKDRPKGAPLFLELRQQLANVGERADWIREPLGEKEIDGQRLVGFRLTGHGLIVDLWGDPKTGMPVRIENSSPSNPSIKPIVYSDFVFNEKLDESLFSLEPPAEYKVRKQTIDASPAEEKDLVETLRRYSELREGTLPDQLDLNALTQLFLENWEKSHPSKGGFPSEQEMQDRLDEMRKFTRGISFAFEQLPREADAHYAGKGIKLGAADTPIFWYHPKDSKKYRVIYADLTVREADAAPEVPDAQPIVSASGPKR